MSVDFGSDLSCVTDIDPGCSVVTGRLLLAQAIARRLSTPRGMVIDDPNYGTDLTDYVNADVSPRDISAMRAAIVAEAQKDERVEAVSVVVTPPPPSQLGIGKYRAAITITDADGPFPLTLAISDVTVELLTIEGV